MHCVAEQAVGCSTPTLSPQERQDPDGPGDVLDLDMDELSQHECMAPLVVQATKSCSKHKEQAGPF